MNDILKALHTDHDHFTRLLDLLHESLDCLRAGERPDYTLMLDIVVYLTEYADLYHHPREDLIYEAYLQRGGAGGAINNLLQQHAGMKEQTAALRSVIEGLLQDAVMSKPRFISLLAEFIDEQRAHLIAEEAEVLPWIQEALTDRDWDTIAARLPARIDPLFGGRVARQYEALYARIGEPVAA